MRSAPKPTLPSAAPEDPGARPVGARGRAAARVGLWARLRRWAAGQRDGPAGSPLRQAAPTAAPDPARSPIVAPWRAALPAEGEGSAAQRSTLVRRLFELADSAPAPADRAFALRLVRTLGDPRLELPLFPDAAQALHKALSAGETSAAALVPWVQREPDLVRRVWQAASASSFARGVTSLDHAIARIGTEALWRLAMDAAVNGPVFRVGRLQPLLDRSRRQGLAAAEVAAWLAGEGRAEAWLAGLLHRSGMLLVLRAAAQGPPPSPAAVERVAAAACAGLGALTVEVWGLGEAVAAAVGAHPEPEGAPPDHRSLSRLVWAAHVAVLSAEEGAAGRDVGGRGALERARAWCVDPDATLARAAGAWRAAGGPRPALRAVV